MKKLLTTAAAIAAFAALSFASAVQAHEFKLGDIRIGHPYAVPSLAGVPNGMAFFDLANQGKDGDRLVRLSSPAAASVEVHEMKTEGGVMKMRALDGLPVAAGQSVKMADSGLHVMLLGLKAPLKAGDKFPMILGFEKGGDTTVEVHVQEKKAGGAGAPHSH